MKATICTVLLTNLFASPLLQAKEYHHIQLESSKLSFVYQQMQVPISGQLTKYSAQFSFDPEHLPTAKAVLVMDLASLDAGSEDANAEISKPAWFASLAFPHAQFVSTEIKALADKHYQVRGIMTIKGRSKEITGLFSYQDNNLSAVFDGGFTLNRSDFAIGEGAWADYTIVANQVLIQFHLIADVQ